MILICQSRTKAKSGGSARESAGFFFSSLMSEQDPIATGQGQIPSKEKLLLASKGNLPDHLQSALLSEGAHAEALLEALASNSNLTKPVQQALAENKSVKVRAALAANQAVDIDIMRQMLHDPAVDVRVALIRDWWMDSAIELALAQDKEVSVRCAVATIERLSKAVQLLLATDPDKSVRTSLLRRDSHFMFSLHRQAQEVLARDSQQPIRELLAAYPKLTPSVQLLLAKDSMIGVRKALAKGYEEFIGANLCEKAQLLLAHDHESSVRLVLAEHCKLSPTVQALLAQDSLVSVRLKLVEASSLLRPLAPETQRILSKDHDSKVRQELAFHLFGVLVQPSEEDVQLTLASDPDPDVKRAVLASLRYGSRRISDAVKERLVEGLDDDTRQTVEEMLDSSEED
jgi:hypothetical protein